jgi:hypothetical protein
MNYAKQMTNIKTKIKKGRNLENEMECLKTINQYHKTNEIKANELNINLFTRKRAETKISNENSKLSTVNYLITFFLCKRCRIASTTKKKQVMFL